MRRSVCRLTLGELSASRSISSTITTPNGRNASNTRVFASPPVVLQAPLCGDDAHVDVAPTAQVVVYPRGDGFQDELLGFFLVQLLPVAPLM